MIRRRLCLGAAAIALTVPLAGCVTVHGERALVPSIRPGEEAEVLAHFTAENDRATKAYDERGITAVEAGPLGAIDQAGVRARRADHPDGNSAYTPLVLSDRKFFVPKQRGWPKFFVTEAKTNRATDQRWLLVFRRVGPDAPWQADFLGVAAPDALPDFALDQDGYAQAVPMSGTDLVVQPGQLSRQYVNYLDSAGKDDGIFADGPSTSGIKQTHASNARSASSVTQYADQADTSGDFAPVALRTKDGGAVVFFGSRHQSRSTFRPGHQFSLDKETQALTTGTPKTSITLAHVAQSMVTVPPRSAAKRQVVFVSRLEGLISATGA